MIFHHYMCGVSFSGLSFALPDSLKSVCSLKLKADQQFIAKTDTDSMLDPNDTRDPTYIPAGSLQRLASIQLGSR
jgi:hypothetical protein